MNKTHRFIFETELPNQLPVVRWIHHLSTNDQFYLGVSGIGLDPGEDASAHGADGVVGVRPDVQVVDLAALVGEPHDQRDVLPTERPERGGQKEGLRKCVCVSVCVCVCMCLSVCLPGHGQYGPLLVVVAVALVDVLLQHGEHSDHADGLLAGNIDAVLVPV